METYLTGGTQQRLRQSIARVSRWWSRNRQQENQLKTAFFFSYGMVEDLIRKWFRASI